MSHVVDPCGPRSADAIEPVGLAPAQEERATDQIQELAKLGRVEDYLAPTTIGEAGRDREPPPAAGGGAL